MSRKIKSDNRGFTLAELLVVLAIISILVSVSLAIFTAQRKKAVIATNKANIRAAKAAALVEYYNNDLVTINMNNLKTSYFIYDVNAGSLSRADFNNFTMANKTAMASAEQAKKYEVVDLIYVYIGESDQTGKKTAIDVETAPHYHGDTVHINGSNPFGWNLKE